METKFHYHWDFDSFILSYMGLGFNISSFYFHSYFHVPNETLDNVWYVGIEMRINILFLFLFDLE